MKENHKICYNCGKVAPSIESPLERVDDTKISNIFDRWKSRGQSWIEKSEKPIYNLFKKAEGYILEKRKKVSGVLKRKLSDREVEKIENKTD